MKKLLLGALLLLSVTMFSQETFVRKYTSMVSRRDGVLQPWENINLTVVFNPNKVKDVVFYYTSGKTLTLHQTSSVTLDTTNDGKEFQRIECVDQDGMKLILQLFDTYNCVRIIISDGYMVEFHDN